MFLVLLFTKFYTEQTFLPYYSKCLFHYIGDFRLNCLFGSLLVVVTFKFARDFIAPGFKLLVLKYDNVLALFGLFVLVLL